MASLIALILVSAMAIPFIALPAANAQTGVKKNTFAIIGALPNPVGVGQETLILTGITHATAWPQPGWVGLTVTVTKPDGTTITLGPVTTDTTGMTGIDYTPSVAGTYYLQTNFPEQIIGYNAAGTLQNTTMKASTSDKLTLIVTEEPRQFYPAAPLPTDYWTRPVNAQFREWTGIAGNWLGVLGYDNRLPPNNDDAPETAHMLWARQLAEGGLVGGTDLNAVNIDSISYEHGDAYEGKFATPVIMNGVLFYNLHPAQSAMMYPNTTWGYTGFEEEQRVVAVDLHTGKELWNKVLGNNERLAFGQIFYWKTMNMYGAFSYLWTVNTVYNTTSTARNVIRTDWKAYDPFTGRWEYTIEGVPSGYRTTGPNGEILIYSMNHNTRLLTMWNSTECAYKSYLNFYLSRPGVAGQPGGFVPPAPLYVDPTTTAPGVPTSDKDVAEYYAGRWRPHGINFSAAVGIQWNMTIPAGLPINTPGTALLTSNIQTVVGNDIILGSNTNWAGGGQQPNPVFWALSVKPADVRPGQEAKLLFNKTWTLPMADVHVDVPGSEPASLEDNVFIVTVKELRTNYAFSLTTGEQLWGPTQPATPYLSVFTNLYMNPWGAAVIKYGKLYTAGMAGVADAYDIKTGQHLWRYNNTDPYTEQLFSENWPTPVDFIVDGKIYLFHQEHSANTPVPRGAPAVCLNATTGQVIWRIDGLRLGTRWGGQPIIGDSIIAGFSSYDNQVVALGKGPTATTVTAPDAGVAFGSSVTIKGMITDISPGTEDAGLKLRFPNGVAAVADDSMSEWMKYVYMQFPRPTNATGVEVILSVLDSNNNFREIGRTTSDASGFFSFDWIPDISGKYTVFAKFAGSNSYWHSSAETAFTVEPASSPPAQEPQQPPSMTDTYVLAGVAAIIVAVAIVGAVIVLILRKRP
jgi:hypothetical protein